MAGAGRADITPAPGTPQGGWGAQTHQRGIGADLPLYATALVLSDGEQQMAIADLDAIGFDAEWTDKIRDAIAAISGLARSNIRVSCSHTHSGPNTFRMQFITEGRDLIAAYLDSLPGRVAGAVWQAQQNLKPVRCATGTGACDINVNRRIKTADGTACVGRNREGVVDHTVKVIRFDDHEENVVATILHYACHPTIMGWQNRYVTPDYPGVARQVVESQIGGTCLFLQGATGNLGPRRGFTGDLDVYRRLGTILGLEAAKVALSIETLPRIEHFTGVQQSGAAIALYDDRPEEPATPELRVLCRDIKLPLKENPDPAVAEERAEEARAKLSRLRSRGTEEEIRAASAIATQLGMTAERARLYHGKSHIPWKLQGIRIGTTALLSIPGEPFIEIAQAISSGSPFRDTLFSGYSNGGFGYLPVRSAYPEGGYEIDTTPFSPDAADVVVQESLRLLQSLL